MLQRLEQKSIIGGNHGGFPVHFADNLAGIKGLHLHQQGLLVVPRQKQQAFHQPLHALGFLGNGGDALLQHGLIVLAPAVEHVHITLNNRNGRA